MAFNARNWLQRFRSAYRCAVAGYHGARVSFAQYGEDIIISNILQNIGVVNPTYLDIGAHHPTQLSNTYLMYSQGCRGVCVEPDPSLYALLNGSRPRDVCINAGVGTTTVSEADFYIITAKTLSTFSKREAERYEKLGTHKIQRVIKMPLVQVNDVIKDHFSSFPNLVSLDVEGLDLEIIRTFDFSSVRPEVFCIETIEYAESGISEKINDIIDIMTSHGYLAFADTFVNTIFVDRDAWANRRPNNRASNYITQ